MPEKLVRELTEKQIAAVNKVLSSDNRVELVPVRDGVKVLEIKRKEVK